MRAKLQKTSMNNDGAYFVQFRVEPDEVGKNGEELLAMRRYDLVDVVSEERQSSVGNEGTIEFKKLSFQSTNTSISLCVLESGILATITLSFEDPKVIETIVKDGLINKEFNLSWALQATRQGERLPTGEGNGSLKNECLESRRF